MNLHPNHHSVNDSYFLLLAGGTNENYNNNDPSIKKCLRKTRGELLLQEYEVGFSWCYIFMFSSTNLPFMLVQIYKWLNGEHGQPVWTVFQRNRVSRENKIP